MIKSIGFSKILWLISDAIKLLFNKYFYISVLILCLVTISNFSYALKVPKSINNSDKVISADDDHPPATGGPPIGGPCKTRSYP